MSKPVAADIMRISMLREACCLQEYTGLAFSIADIIKECRIA
jgi:hypothetical protein